MGGRDHLGPLAGLTHVGKHSKISIARSLSKRRRWAPGGMCPGPGEWAGLENGGVNPLSLPRAGLPFALSKGDSEPW